MVVRRGVVLLALLALGSCDEGNFVAGPPLSPSPTAAVQGTYTLTVSTSPSCPVQGSWTYRADITQKDQSLEVSVHQLNGETPCAEGSLCGGYCANKFEGRVDAEGGVALFGTDGSKGLFCVSGLSVGKSTGWSTPGGSARGRYQDGRIDALFDGDLTFSSTGNLLSAVGCGSFDHPLTFVRR